MGHSRLKFKVRVGKDWAVRFEKMVRLNILTERMHPKVVSELLGHSSIGLTLDTYSHVIPDMQQQAVVAMDALLRG